MSVGKVVVPDLGDTESVELIELNVAVGDNVELNQPVAVVESEKASMDIEATVAGRVSAVHVKEGDSVQGGTVLLDVVTVAAQASPANKKDSGAADAPTPAGNELAADDVAPNVPAGAARTEVVKLPDTGEAESVAVIEVHVAPGDVVNKDQALVSVESEKASMDVEASAGGKVLVVHVAEGDAVASDDPLVEIETIEVADTPPARETGTDSTAVVSPPLPSPPAPAMAMPAPSTAPAAGAVIYAGPAVRKIAREFGIDLGQVNGSGKNGRLLKEDLQAYVRTMLSRKDGGGSALPALPEVDFKRYGDTRKTAVSKLEQAVARNMYRNWVNLPHVTQFDHADMTKAEALRAQLKTEASKRSLKLTPVSFLVRACALVLRQHEKLNASLLNDGKHLVYKDYVHVGMAVDTPAGLVVPVISDADKKDIWKIAEDVADLAEKARTRKLKQSDMQGGTFTISSLGGIGGRGFTPIINAPEVAILGVSKMEVSPVWDGKKFAPHKLLPLSLSYDHRVVNGADAGRFMTDLVAMLATPDKIIV